VNRRKIIRIGVIALAATALPIMRSGVAGADYAATPYDLVGVGGDTPQFTADFLANGDADGDPGFNAAGNQKRLVTFDAAPDANGRSAYYGPNSGTNSGALQYSTNVLKDGEFPSQRTSSSGNAIFALEADTPGDINFIYSTTGLSGSSYTVPLHEYEFGTDTVSLAAATTTNAPTGLTVAQLAGIYQGTYTTWNQVGGTSTATIVPLLPPPSSAITKTFLSAIGITQAAVNTTVVKTVEQNDPTAITLNASAANAIVPFSAARANLIKGATTPGTTPGPSAPYFPAIVGEPTFNTANQGFSYPLEPQYAAPIQLLTSAATTTVTDYIIIRQSDLSDTGSSTAIEPGSSVNWADYLFAGTTGVTPFINTTAGQTLILDSGVTPVYVDKGLFS
jgi:hypothetical protein